MRRVSMGSGHRTIRLLSIAMILTAAPLTLSSEGLAVNDAGACTAFDGTCCPSTTSAVCIINNFLLFDHYYLATGNCPVT